MNESVIFLRDIVRLTERFLGSKDKVDFILKKIKLGLGCLMPLSTIFQLYRGA
jgi:hypothetical protein